MESKNITNKNQLNTNTLLDADWWRDWSPGSNLVERILYIKMQNENEGSKSLKISLYFHANYLIKGKRKEEVGERYPLHNSTRHPHQHPSTNLAGAC